MRASFLLLKIVAKGVMHTAGFGGIWSVVEDLPELANEIWVAWSAKTTPEGRRSEMEALTQAGEDGIEVGRVFEDDEVRRALDAFPAEARGQVREDVGAFLRQLPVTARQAFRRPEDPTGKTVPPALTPREPRDLIPLLNVRKPQFQKGNRPIPGIDWELDELLGVGGFGEVWKARHCFFPNEPPVTLKFCTDPLARHKLLTTEAVVCDRVRRRGQHPGIVHLQATYLNADPPCLQFEYVDGGDLAGLVRQWSRQERYPSPLEIAQIILEIAEPVAFAHGLDERIVHRDLKPANIMVYKKGETVRFKVTDFGIGGIANAQAIAETRHGHKPGVFVTRSLAGSGTPLYASPEQLRDEPLDPRDDVHALGVIWFQLLVGDLTEGRPGGIGWMEDFTARGMPEPLIRLLSSCFEKARRRPADAGLLCTQLRTIIAGHASGPSDRVPEAATPRMPAPESPKATKPEVAREGRPPTPGTSNQRPGDRPAPGVRPESSKDPARAPEAGAAPRPSDRAVTTPVQQPAMDRAEIEKVLQGFPEDSAFVQQPAKDRAESGKPKSEAALPGSGRGRPKRFWSVVKIIGLSLLGATIGLILLLAFGTQEGADTTNPVRPDPGHAQRIRTMIDFMDRPEAVKSAD